MNPKWKNFLVYSADLGINIIIIVGLVLIIQKWIIAPFDVSGSSMCNTLNYINDQCINSEGEKIIINEALYTLGEPERGDVVVFKAPHEEDEEEKFFIKRVIGLPGETVEIKDGEVYINKDKNSPSIKLEEPYLNEENRGNTQIYLSEFSVFEVPEGYYFLLGDNRKASTDSRSCFSSTLSLECKNTPEKAYIEREAIRGKAWVVWWPLSTIRIIEHYEYPELETSEPQKDSESRAEK